MDRKALIPILILLFAVPLCGQEKRGMTAEDLYEWTVVSDPVFSPGGEWVAFVATRADRETNSYLRDIHLVSADGARRLRLTTHTASDYNPQWSPDGGRIAFVSARSGRPQIHLIGVGGGEAVQLTQMPRGVGSLQWTPDGDSIIFTAAAAPEPGDADTRPPEAETNEEVEREGPRLITDYVYRTGTSYLEETRPHLFIVSVGSTETPRRLTSGTLEVDGFAVSPDGGRVAFSASDTRGGQRRGSLCLLSLADASTTTLLEDIWASRIAWSPGGERIAFAGSDRVRSESTLCTIGDDGSDLRNLTAEFDRSPRDLRWSADGRSIFFLAGDHGNISLWSINADGGQPTLLISGDRQLGTNSYYGGGPHLFALSPNGGCVVATVTDSVSPRELARFDLGGGGEERLTRFNDDLIAGLELSPAEHFIHEIDGVSIDGWVMRPCGFREGERYPAVLEVHGGPSVMWGNAFFQEFQVLASRGYAVVYTNPRGSGGYGTPFMAANAESWGELPGNDILGALDTAISEFPFIDGENLVVTGGSYGGYMTAWLIGRTDRFKAAVPCRGLYNMMSFFTTTDFPDGWEEIFQGWPWSERLEWMLENSPITYVEHVRTPTLVLHSECDFRAPISNAEEYYMALRLAGATVEFLRIPREGHELSRGGEPELLIYRLNRIVEWFDRWLDE